MRELPAPLAPLGAHKQFILYVTRPSSRPGKTDKFPCDFRTGAVVSAHDPAFWTDHKTAIAAAATFGDTYGVGFVFTDNDPFWFLDIDNCLQADNTWSPIAVALCNAFAGAAVEVSQSGRGLHIFGKGRPPAHGCKNAQYGLEFYHADRFVALTGNGATGDAGKDFSAMLPTIVSQFFPTSAGDVSEWTTSPASEWRGPTDDDELIRRAMRSQSTSNAFGGKASFADLWNCNVEVLARNYPDPARAYDESSADAALAQHLAFWTGRDCERIERLMRKSNLVREKWNREDYLPRTIIGAVSRQFEVLSDKVLEVPTEMPAHVTTELPKPTLIEGTTYADGEAQIKLFQGCVYIREQHRVLIPGGHILKPDQFKVAFGGFTFMMDPANERTTRDAWEAFTQSQIFRSPRANSTCFRPDLPPAAIFETSGQSYVNTFWPVEVPRKLGDATPFLNHLKLLIPNERDRQILLSYMAACVQHQGVKFQWAPLIQGTEGNGKTLLTRCVAAAVGRRYTHWPRASQLASPFNAWMLNKVFFGVEDIYVPDQKREVIEELKPMITGGDGLEIQAKGVDQISAEVCGNFMFNSNHKDAITKTNNDRRFAPFFTAQQSVLDVERDGMSGDYFPKLYNWLRDEGYAIVSELLHTFPIPDEYNPATRCQRAPITSSTHEAIVTSMGGIEQEVLEAINQGLPGFCGEFVSSIKLNELLERIGAARRLTHNKRRELLESLGYHLHPALHDGRVNNSVFPDGGKPRLFVHRKSPHLTLTVAADVAKAYEAANNKMFSVATG